jgi:hypothetical protein
MVSRFRAAEQQYDEPSNEELGIVRWHGWRLVTAYVLGWTAAVAALVGVAAALFQLVAWLL